MESTATKGRAPARSTRLTGRDYVVLVVFGVLLFAVFMVFSIVCSLSATTSWFTHGVGAVPAGIVWMYVLARVPKRGAVALMCLLVALLGLVMGMFWTGPLGIALGGVAAELVLGAPGERTAFRRVAAFVAFVVCFWAGHVSLVYLTGQAYVDMVVASVMTAEYGQQLVDFMYGPLSLVALAVAVIGPLVGGLLGERVFKKHFARMGA